MRVTAVDWNVEFNLKSLNVLSSGVVFSVAVAASRLANKVQPFVVVVSTAESLGTSHCHHHHHHKHHCIRRPLLLEICLLLFFCPTHTHCSVLLFLNPAPINGVCQIQISRLPIPVSDLVRVRVEFLLLLLDGRQVRYHVSEDQGVDILTQLVQQEPVSDVALLRQILHVLVHGDA